MRPEQANPSKKLREAVRWSKNQPSNGKGSRQRPMNKAKFDENYDRIFGPERREKK